MMLSVLDLIPLFKNIGDAWIRVCCDAWIRVCWQEISIWGSGLNEQKPHPFGFYMTPRCGS